MEILPKSFNKKISTPLGIVVILFFALLVGGGILGYQYYWLPKREVETPEIKKPEKEAEVDKFAIIQRIPEGTQTSLVSEEKIVQSPLSRIYIVFNREVNKATLTEDHFYALWEIDEKVPCRIEYEEHTKTASLVFDKEIKGGRAGYENRITVIAEGIQDLEGNQLERLLYNVDIGVSEIEIPERVVEEETVNWKTYRNEEYGYEIKYPDYWKVEERNENNAWFFPFEDEGAVGALLVWVEWEPDADYSALLDYLSSAAYREYKETSWVNIYEKGFVRIEGEEFFKHRFSFQLLEGEEYIGVRDGDLVRLGMRAELPNYSTKLEDFYAYSIFHRMISTFRFLE